MTEIQYQIIREIYIALERLGAGIHLLGAVGSWGDTLEEEEVLDLLRNENGTLTSLPAEPKALAEGQSQSESTSQKS